MFRTVLLLLLSLSSVIATARLHGAEIRLALANAGEHVRARNPALAAARLRIDEARGRLRGSGRLSNPELEAEYAKNVRSPEDSLEVSLTQRFPVTSRLRHEKAVSRAELDAAVAEVRDEERKLIGETRGLIVRLLGLEAQRTLRKRQLRNSRDLAEFTRRRVKSAEASAMEAAEVELDAAELSLELTQLTAEDAALRGQLRPLVGAAPGDDILLLDDGLTAPGRLPPPAGAGLKLKQRPDFRAALSKAEAARRAVHLARAQSFGDIAVGVLFAREYEEDAPEGFMREVMAGVRLSVPLPLWDRQQGRRQEAEAASLRATREIHALALTIRAEAEAARVEMRVLAAAVHALDDEILPNAVALEEGTRSAYEAGQSPLPEVMRARNKRLFLERRRVETLRDFHLARVRFEAATGQDSREANPVRSRSSK